MDFIPEAFGGDHIVPGLENLERRNLRFSPERGQLTSGLRFEVLRVPLLDDGPLVHKGDAVATLGLVHIGSTEKNCDAAFLH